MSMCMCPHVRERALGETPPQQSTATDKHTTKLYNFRIDIRQNTSQLSTDTVESV